jgi:hypothetical protein
LGARPAGGSLDAAQDALKDLRRELSKGGRDLLKDLDALLRDARKNLRRAQRTLVKDLEESSEGRSGEAPPRHTARAREADDRDKARRRCLAGQADRAGHSRGAQDLGPRTDSREAAPTRAAH